MPTLNLQVAASSDDARNVSSNGTYNGTVVAQHIGNNAGVDYWNGFRWLNITIPQGATISSAVLDLYSAGVGTGSSAPCRFYGELATNAVTFANTTGDKPEGRSRTTALVDKTFSPASWTATGFGIDTVDVTSLVQEIVNQGGWSSGNALVIVGHNNGASSNNYIGHSTYDSNTSRGAKLDITYSSATAAPTAPSALSVVADNEYRTVLNWTDNQAAGANDEGTFRVERKTGSGGTYSEVGTTITGVTHYIDLTASASTTYYYRVRARNSVGDSSYCTEQAVITPAANSPWTATIGGWLYPTATYSPVTEYSDGRVLRRLNPEYLHLNSSGAIVTLSAPGDGTYAHSSGNATSVKAHSYEQYITVSSGTYADIQTLVNDSTKRSAAVTAIDSFIVTNNFTGAEIDFEKFSSWGVTEYGNFKTFVSSLASTLNSHGKKLIVHGPNIANSTDQGFYQFKFEEVYSLCDYVAVQVYDHHYDTGAGTPISPDAWAQSVCDWVISKVGWANRGKIMAGMPSYSYQGPTGEFATIVNETYQDSTGHTGFSGASRDGSSHEIMWANGGSSYSYQDSTSLDAKRKVIEDKGIQLINVWHLGGNNWFSGTRAEVANPAGSSRKKTAFLQFMS